MWADTLLRPGLRESEFGRVLQRNLTRLVQLRAAPNGVAGRITDSIVFGPSHPEGQIVTEKSLQAIRVKDCRKYLRSRVRPNGAKIFAVGNISKRQLQQRLQRLFFGWYGSGAAAPTLPAPRPRKGKIFFVDIPGAQQAVIRMVHRGPPRTARDYYATSLASAILGGGFSSRINMTIREKKGYSYGASGRFYYTRQDGYFLAQAAVRNDVAGASVKEILREVLQMSKGSVTEEEFKREVAGAILALPAAFERGGKILDSYHSLVYYGLPLSYYDNYVANIRRVSRSDVEEAAKRHLAPDEMRILVVGDGKSVEPQVRDLLKLPAIRASSIVHLDRDGMVL